MYWRHQEEQKRLEEEEAQREEQKLAAEQARLAAAFAAEQEKEKQKAARAAEGEQAVAQAWTNAREQAALNRRRSVADAARARGVNCEYGDDHAFCGRDKSV